MNLITSISRKITCVILGVALTIGVISCKEEEVKSVAFEISANQFDFLAEGGLCDVKVSSGEEWTVESDAEWCLVSPANGIGSVECELRVDTSYLYKSREALLTFHSGSQSRQIKVSQLGYEKVIHPKVEMVEVPDFKRLEDAYFEVEVISNVDFEVELPEDGKWLSYEIMDQHVTSVPRPRKVIFKYKTNTNPEKRLADVVLKPVLEKDQSAEPATISVLQGAAPFIEPSRSGDSIAIVLINRAMNEDDPTLSGKSMIHWEKVKLAEFPKENGNPGETELRVVALDLFLYDTDESFPYQIKYLTKLESFTAKGNSNGYIKNITWTPEICELENLKSIEIIGHGFANIPEEIAGMKSLESLSLYMCYLPELPINVFKRMPNLKRINISGGRRGDVYDLSAYQGEEIGLGGKLPREIFELDQLESLKLSYNAFDGTIPEMPLGSMPNLKELSINGNFLTGEVPEWILKHPYFGCWDPAVLIFGQENGKDTDGNRAGFTNEPKRFPDCPLYYY